jgi:hypothetical protein
MKRARSEEDPVLMCYWHENTVDDVHEEVYARLDRTSRLCLAWTCKREWARCPYGPDLPLLEQCVYDGHMKLMDKILGTRNTNPLNVMQFLVAAVRAGRPDMFSYWIVYCSPYSNEPLHSIVRYAQCELLDLLLEWQSKLTNTRKLAISMLDCIILAAVDYGTFDVISTHLEYTYRDELFALNSCFNCNRSVLWHYQGHGISQIRAWVERLLLHDADVDLINV